MRDRVVPSRRFTVATILVGIVATTTLAQQPARAVAASSAAVHGGSKYLFAWTGDSARKSSDFLAVVDADPGSKTYGHIVASVAANAVGTWPHHTEYEFPQDGILMANGFAGSKTFAIDLRQPTAPKLISTFTAAGPYAFPHSFARLPNGHLLATMQGRRGAYGPPGGVVELDERGTFVRGATAAGLGLADTLAWPYSLAVDAKHDRAVVTVVSMPIPDWLHAPAGSWRKARADSSLTDQIEIWSLANLKLQKVISLPNPPHAKVIDGLTAKEFPAEPRLLPDGSMYVNTFNCGLYRVTAIESANPRVEFLHEFPLMTSMPCAVPAIVGHFWVQTVGALPGLIVLDIQNPAHPVEVSRLVLDKKLGMAHWLASDPSGSRVVLTGDGMGYALIIDVDPRTGALSIDKRFRDERTGAPGVSLDGRQWPHGNIARAMVHGTLFGPR